MPVLEHPKETVRIALPPREAVLAAETDVLVIGGGPAGLAAAWGAAKEGSKVILAERYGFLGGNATVALVTMLTTFYTRARRKVRTAKTRSGTITLYPTDHGPGHPVIAGFLGELIERLVREGGAIAPSLMTGHTVPFDPEIFKQVAMEMMDEAGVHMLFHSFASGIIGDKGKIDGVIFESKSGPVVVRAKCFVDCSGDGDVACHAGAPFIVGRDEDGLTQPMTLYFRLMQVNLPGFEKYVTERPDQWNGVFGLGELVQKATKEGNLKLPREDILMFSTPNPQEISVNCTRVTRVLGIDVWDLTYAEWTARRQMQNIVAFFKKYVPGFENCTNIQSGVSVGVRETRRIIGDYILTGPDILSAKKFDDVIARGTYPLDIHNPKGKGTILKRLPANEAYDIPLRCLIPQKTFNLLVAGRCISGNHGAMASYRVMPIAMATGQAAGICAALAARKGKPPREIPAREVQRELVKQKADLRGIVTAPEKRVRQTKKKVPVTA